MQIVTLSEKTKRLEARKCLLGITPAQIKAARNNGRRRTAGKRTLLRTLQKEARRQGRAVPFAASF
jgi:hypothetical protein